MTKLLFSAALAAFVAVAMPPSASAQGHAKAKHYAASSDRAIAVTRTVLQEQGFDVVKVQRVDQAHVVYYRRGNNGRGKGKGPMEKLVIRTVKERVVFEETAPDILVNIDLRLRL